ncbi:ARID DNA-binding domain-containing protein, partial [Tanacetum coccineum]
MPQMEFAQRKIKREKEERIGKCIRHITKDCKDMLRRKIKEIKIHNSANSQSKYKEYNCFYCNQKGYVFKSCPVKIKDDAECKQGHHMETTEGSIRVYHTTQAKITQKEFLVEKLEDQRKLLFTYGMGEVVIKDGGNGCLIPGVHYAPEVTLNILSIDILKQQGFDIISEGDRWTLEYMFKKQKGQNMDIDKMRQRHNDYLDDYFESLDKERTDRMEQEPRIVEDTNASEVHTFQEFVAFLNLIKNDDVISKGWDIYRNRFDKMCAPIAVEKGKETLEHFGIKLEEEDVCKEQQPVYYGKEQPQITCYRCQNSGHYAFECPNKNKDQGKYSSYKEPSTSRILDKEGSYGSI